jgi:hypothetical protein
MMRIAFPLLLVFWSALVAGQNTFSVVHSHPAASASDGRGVFETGEGYLVFSAEHDPAFDRTWLYTTTFTPQGEELETHVFSSTRHLHAGLVDCIARNPDGTFTAAVGHFINVNGEPDSLFLYHFAADGDTISTHLIAVEPSIAMRDCAPTLDGNYLLAGWCTLIVEPLEECPCLLKVSPTGEELWRVETPGYWDYYRTINPLDDGSFLIGAGRFNQGYNETVIQKVNSVGATIWTRYIGGYSSYGGGSGHSVVMANGNYLIPGVWLPPDSAGVDEHGFVAFYCFSPDGEPLWRKDVFYGRMADATLVRRRMDGGMIIPSGYFQVPRDPDLATTIWYTDSAGDTLCHRKYWYYGGYGAWNPASYGMDLTSDGGAIFTGLARQGQDGEFPYRRYTWVLKLDEHGCLTPGCHTVGVQEYELALQSVLELAPNPASEHLSVALALPEGYPLEGAVQAVLLDVQGKQVQQQTLPSGTLELRGTMPVVGLAPGLYYLHLRDGRKWLAGGKVVVSAP